MDEESLQSDEAKQNLLQILFDTVSSRDENGNGIEYKQGMHELAAIVYFVTLEAVNEEKEKYSNGFFPLI